MRRVTLSVLFGAAVLAAQVRIESPLDYQVFQRDTKLKGTVRIRGRAESGCDAAQYRLKDGARWEVLKTEPGCAFNGEARTDAGGWYTLELRVLRGGLPAGSATVGHVGVGEVFVISGQSNATNYGETLLQPASGMVSSFSGSDWAPANDPQPGAQDKSTKGSFVAPFGDALYEHYKVPIAVASTGYGGTSVRQWLPKGERFTIPVTSPMFVKPVGQDEWESDGTLFEGMMTRIAQLGPHGFRALLWHQGESDSYRKPEQQLSSEQYRALMEKVIRASRAGAGWDFPWFVAQVSYGTPERSSFAPIREAQAALWASGIALQGPDTDALTGAMRQNNGKGVHLSAEGLKAHGRLWADKVSAWLDRTAWKRVRSSLENRFTRRSAAILLRIFDLDRATAWSALIFIPVASASS